MMRSILTALWVTALVASGAAAADQAGVVQKPAVDVYAEPRLDAPKISTLKRDAAVTIASQQGLWYALRLPDGATGTCASTTCGSRRTDRAAAGASAR